MKFSVCTTFSEQGYNKYGRRMIQSFLDNWPDEITLYVYYENNKPEIENSQIIYYDLLEVSPDLVNFKNKYKNEVIPRGIYQQKRYKIFRYDAVKFCHKIYCIYHASTTIKTDYLIWLDADSYTYKNIPISLFHELVTKKHYLTYLGRDGYDSKGKIMYSECGFVIYNINHPQHLAFQKEMVHMYNSGDLFYEKEWHDSWIFDVVRRQFESRKLIKNININVLNSLKHPFINSILGNYIDHLKGVRRKSKKKSNIEDLESKNKNKHNFIEYLKKTY